MLTLGSDGAQGRASTPSATRAARPTWAGSTTTGSASTTASPTSPARSASPSSSGSTTCSPPARRVAGWYRDGAGGAGRRARASGCRARTPAATAAAGSCSSSSSRAASTATPTIRALRELGVQSKPYLPAIHLMSFYRERFGHRPGRVPGLRGRRRPLGRAAVLPGAGRGARSRASPRRSAACWAERDHRPLRRWPCRRSWPVLPELGGGRGPGGCRARARRSRVASSGRSPKRSCDRSRTRRAGALGRRPARRASACTSSGPASSAKNSLSSPRSRILRRARDRLGEPLGEPARARSSVIA